MPRMNVKHIHKVKKKLSGGKVIYYHYAWRGGPQFYRSDDGFSENGPEYWACYNNILKDLVPAQGYFRQILIAFLKSPEFSKLASRSQEDMKRSISHPTQGIDHRFGEAPIKAFEDPRIRQIAYAWRDEKAKTSLRGADMIITHLGTILSWAADRNLLKCNNLLNMKKLYSSNRSEIYWSEAEILQFHNVAPTYVSNILTVAVETGLRPGDLALLNRSNFQGATSGQRIVMRTSKRGRVVSIPVTDELSKVINSMPKDQFQVLVSKKGLPFADSDSLGPLITKYRRVAGIREELRLQDCRGTAATKLFKANLSVRELAVFMGWSVKNAADMIERYCSMHPEDNSDVLIRLKSH
mgnify:FL=1